MRSRGGASSSIKASRVDGDDDAVMFLAVALIGWTNLAYVITSKIDTPTHVIDTDASLSPKEWNGRQAWQVVDISRYPLVPRLPLHG